MVVLLIRFIAISGGILLVAFLVPGISVSGKGPALMAAFILGLLNVSIRPVMMYFAMPLRLLTLGFFTLVINAAMLYIVGSVVTGFDIDGFASAFLGALFISLISAVVNEFVERE